MVIKRAEGLAAAWQEMTAATTEEEQRRARALVWFARTLRAYRPPKQRRRRSQRAPST